MPRRYFMKNGESDAQIPELVAKAMVATYEYSLEQLKSLPHAEDILNDVLNPGAAAEGAEASELGAPAICSSMHAAGGVMKVGGAARRDAHAGPEGHAAAQENGQQARARPHAASAAGQAVGFRPPASAAGRSKMVRTHATVAGSREDGPLLQAPPGAAGMPTSTAADAAAAAAAAGVFKQQQQQAYVPHAEQEAFAAGGVMGGARKPSAGGKGAKAANGKPMSKQQAKQHQQAHHAHAQAARHHHMMMGHLHPGYMAYPHMAPQHAAAYGMPAYAMLPHPTHEQAMAHAVQHQHAHPHQLPHPHVHVHVHAHAQAQDYAAMQRPGSEHVEPSARDPYGSMEKGGKDAAKGALHMHNPYGGLDMARMMGKPAGSSAPASKSSGAAKGPAGKGKCKPPRASSLGSTMPKGKTSGGGASSKASGKNGSSGGLVSVLGATKGHRGTRVVQGKLLPVEGRGGGFESPRQVAGSGASSCGPGGAGSAQQPARVDASHATYLEEPGKHGMDESPGFNSMLVMSSPPVSSELTLSPMNHYVLAPLSVEKGPRQYGEGASSTRLGPETTPGSAAAREVLPGAQWFLSPLLQSKDSPSNVWRNSPFMQSNLSPQMSPMMNALDRSAAVSTHKRKVPSPFISYATTSHGVVQLNQSTKRAKGGDCKPEGRLSLLSSEVEAATKGEGAEDDEMGGGGGGGFVQGGEPSPTLSMMSCGSMSAFALGVASGNGARSLDMHAKDEAPNASCSGIIDQAVAAVDTSVAALSPFTSPHLPTPCTARCLSVPVERRRAKGRRHSTRLNQMKLHYPRKATLHSTRLDQRQLH